MTLVNDHLRKGMNGNFHVPRLSNRPPECRFAKSLIPVGLLYGLPETQPFSSIAVDSKGVEGETA